MSFDVEDDLESYDPGGPPPFPPYMEGFSPGLISTEQALGTRSLGTDPEVATYALIQTMDREPFNVNWWFYVTADSVAGLPMMIVAGEEGFNPTLAYAGDSFGPTFTNRFLFTPDSVNVPVSSDPQPSGWYRYRIEFDGSQVSVSVTDTADATIMSYSYAETGPTTGNLGAVAVIPPDSWVDNIGMAYTPPEPPSPTPPPSPSYRLNLPEVYLALSDSGWPIGDGTPCRPGTGLSRVGDWTVEREIVGNMLPGNVRARTGLSVGSASATIPQTNPVMTPWDKGPSRVVPRGRATLFTADDPTNPTQNLGEWVVDPVSGSLLSGQVDVQLAEVNSVGKKPEHTAPPAYTSSPRDLHDAVWLVSVLADQLGYRDTPPPAPSAIFEASMNGSPLPSTGIILPPDWESRPSGSGVSYDHSSGSLGLTAYGSDFHLMCLRSDQRMDFSEGPLLSLMFNSDGPVRFNLGLAIEDLYWPPVLEVDRAANTFRIWNVEGSGAGTSETIPPAADSRWVNRVEVQVERLNYGEDGRWGATRARVRTGSSAVWSAWATNSATHPPFPVPWPFLGVAFLSAIELVLPEGSSISGLQMVPEEFNGAGWQLPERWADLQPLGKTMTVPYLEGHTSPWDGIQEVVSSVLGAAWLTWEGVLKVRNAEYLAGASTDVHYIDVDLRAEDLPWSVDPADVADRVEVTYRPVDLVWENTQTVGDYVQPLVWQAEEAYEILPGQTLEVVAYTDSTVVYPMEFNPNLPWNQGSGALWARWSAIWSDRPAGLNSTSSWSAFPNREGTGTHPGDDALTVRSRSLSLSRVLIQITNNTNQTLYTVDANGDPHLLYRQIMMASQDNTATVVRGIPSEKLASNPISVDLGRHVQTQESAEQIATYIWDRVSTQQWKASSVRIVLDWTIDIGSLIRLVHTPTGLSQKALVTRVALQGSPGNITQTLDLVLLDPTWFDFDNAWTGQTWDDFDAEWAGQRWIDFDNNPTLS